jgi:nucleoside phosphorylase
LNAARSLEAHRRQQRQDPLYDHVSRINTSVRGLRIFERPASSNDQLYEAGYVHLIAGKPCKKSGCDASKQIKRWTDDSDMESQEEQNDEWLVTYRGTVASGELVIKNGSLRLALAQQLNILCFETEAAGAFNNFPWLVIRGIADHADSHKNDKWHGHAAATAAAYAIELFFHMPIDGVWQCRVAESGGSQQRRWS